MIDVSVGTKRRVRFPIPKHSIEIVRAGTCFRLDSDTLWLTANDTRDWSQRLRTVGRGSDDDTDTLSSTAFGFSITPAARTNYNEN